MSDDYKEYEYREPIKARYVDKGERLVTLDGVQYTSEDLVHVLLPGEQKLLSVERFEELFAEKEEPEHVETPNTAPPADSGIKGLLRKKS